MSDPFAKWRDRRPARPPQVVAAETPIAVYETPYLSRGWAIALLLGWAPCMIALLIWMMMNERAIKDAVSWGTGLMTLATLTLLCSLVAVPLLAASRRAWTLHADSLEIRQRPLIPLLGPYRHARIAFADIAAARMGEALNGMPVAEMESRAGARYRLAPRHIGKGRNVRLDLNGFNDFIEQIGAAIVAAGYPRPAGERMDTAGTGLSGVVILSVITALLGALCLFGVWATATGEPLGMQALALGVPLTLLFAGLLRSRWAKWRAGTG